MSQDTITSHQRVLEKLVRHHASGNINDDIISVSVLSHVKQILNTRQGSVLIDGEFGMQCLSEKNNVPENTLSFIKSLLTKYEPRIYRISLKSKKKEKSHQLIRINFEFTLHKFQSFSRKYQKIEVDGFFLTDGTFNFDDDWNKSYV